jgi:hypothetical protein
VNQQPGSLVLREPKARDVFGSSIKFNKRSRERRRKRW